MKISNDKLEITDEEIIYWQDVKRMRLINDKLAFIMKDGRVIELSSMRPTTVDLVFRSYEKFLKEHPQKKITKKLT